MLRHILRWSSMTLLCILLWRNWRGAVFKTFFSFYAYMVADAAGTVLAYGIYYSDKLQYVRWYWIVTFGTLFLGIVILWEMLVRMWFPFQTLSRAARICQAALGAIVAAVAERICAYLQATSFDAATIIWLVELWKPGEPALTACSTGQGSESSERPPYSTVRSAPAFRYTGPRAARA